LAVAAMASFLGMLAGCGEKDVPYIIDADEITRYINEVGVARELFRTAGLINPGSYTVPFDSAEFYDSVVAQRRSMVVNLVPLKVLGPNGDSIPNDPNRIYADHDYLGRVRESVVRVEDRFTIQTSRVYSDTTLLDTTIFALNRYAFFLKLGDDTRPYVGWVLWGFNGIGSVGPAIGVTLVGSAGASFRGDLALYPDLPRSISTAIPQVPYIRLSEMDTVVAGSRLLVTTSGSSQTNPTVQLVSDYSQSGPFVRPLIRYDTVNVLDSLSYQTPTNQPRLYNQLMIQLVADGNHRNRTGFVVPYRR
jgi:hypothetical protein